MFSYQGQCYIRASNNVIAMNLIISKILMFITWVIADGEAECNYAILECPIAGEKKNMLITNLPMFAVHYIVHDMRLCTSDT